MRKISAIFSELIKKNKKLVILVGIFGIFGVLSYFIYDYYNAKNELSEYKDDSSLSAIKERNKLLERIHETVKVPDDEEPTIATVTNAFRLRGQTFFAQSENGDKVIIYPKSGRAILYRPSINKIIEAAPVNITDIEGSVAGSSDQVDGSLQNAQNTKESTASTNNTSITEPDPQEPAKIAIYNGTITLQGIAGNLATYLLGYFSEDKLDVTLLSNADESFDSTLVINNTNRYNNLSAELVVLLDAQETSLPDSEDIPQDVDILIIIGKDIEKTKLDIL